MKTKLRIAVATLLMLLTFSNVQAQSTRNLNENLYSKELKKSWDKLKLIWKDKHKDKKEEGVVEDFLKIAKMHPEEEGLCDLFIADFYMRRTNHTNYDSAIYYYQKADAYLPDNMPFERTVVYNNLIPHYVRQDSINKAFVYAHLAASIDSIQCAYLSRLCLYGGPEYFNPILAIKYSQTALREGLAEDLFPLIYASQYIINTINEGTFDSVAFEYHRKTLYMMTDACDKEEPAPYLEMAAERNYFPAVVDLATYIACRKIYAEKDHKEMCERAITLLQPLVDADYPPALHAMGMAIEYNNLIMGGALVSPEGFKQAYPYFERGCNLGYPPSITEVGRYHEMNLGRLFGVNPEVALQYYNAAEKEGYYQATRLKKALYSKAEFKEAMRELAYATKSLIQEIQQTKELFDSKEFAQKYESSSVQRTSSSKTNQVSHSSNASAGGDSNKKNIPSGSALQLMHTSQKVYDDYVGMLMSMCYGHSFYSDRNRRDYQSKMRQICQDWDSKGYDPAYRIYRSEEWENWNGECKYYKK